MIRELIFMQLCKLMFGLLLIGLFMPAKAFADRIISDPYPLTVAQPTTCRASFDGGLFVGYAVLANADGSVYCSVTIPTLAGGSHVVSVKACISPTATTFECSDPPTTLNFTLPVLGVPTGPKNLRKVSP